MIDAQKGMLGGKPMRAVVVGAEIYVHEDDARRAIKDALATNVARNNLISNLESELAAEKAARERAEAERDALRTKWERGCFCLMEMMQAYERRIRSLSTPAEIEKKPWECAEYRSAAGYLRSAWHQQPDDSARKGKP